MHANLRACGTQAEEERVRTGKRRVEALLARGSSHIGQLPIRSAAEAAALSHLVQDTQADTTLIEAEIARCQHEQLMSITYSCPELDMPALSCAASQDAFRCLSSRNAQIQRVHASCAAEGESEVASWKRFAVELNLSSESVRWNQSSSTAHFSIRCWLGGSVTFFSGSQTSSA